MSREAIHFLEDIESACANIIVWDTICTDVPELLDRVRGIIADQSGQRI